MDIIEIVNLISTVGFPCVCAFFMFNQYTKLNELHKEEYKELKTAIDNNTIALTELVVHIKEGLPNA